MASTDTKTTDGSAKDGSALGGIEAGLDALETSVTGRPPFRQTFREKIFPPIVATVVVLAIWQGLISLKIVDDPSRLPSPAPSGPRSRTRGSGAPCSTTSGPASRAACSASCSP